MATTDCKKLASDWINGSRSVMWTKAGPAMTPFTPSHPCSTTSTSPGCADPGSEATVCSVKAYHEDPG